MAGILGTNFAGRHWRNTPDRSDAIAKARAARDRLSHRGPDFAGDFYDDRVFLGHAEQAGLDSGVVGRLPLASADAGATLTLDGYISNASELRRSLGKRHAFHGNGGAEVVLQAYLQWGFEGMLSRLRGSFALAIYDRTNSRVLLARDALGTRPLYYLHEELASTDVGSLMFASELKALEELADRELLEVDHTAVYDYLTYRYVPAPKTLYKQVRKLAAGQCASFDLTSGFSTLQTYWTLPEPDAALYSSQTEFIERGQELLAAAVAGRLGGPARVAGICQRSGAFAQWLSSTHPEVRPLTLTEADSTPTVAGELAGLDLRGWFDEPFADVSFSARHRLLESLAGTADCALSDLGAEVLFGTAPRYRNAGNAPTGTLGWFKSRLAGAGQKDATGASSERPGSVANSASKNVLDAFGHYARALGGLLPHEKQAQKAAWEIPDDYSDYWYFQQFYRADLPRTLRFQHLDLHTLVPEHQLTQLDRQALRHGIEARTPLLDQDLVTWLLCAPAEWRGPQLDVQAVLFAQSDTSQPMLTRLKESLKGAAAFLPGGKATGAAQAAGTLALLQSRFPELDGVTE